MKKRLSIIIPVSICILIILLAVLNTISKKIPQNPIGTIGNLAGNLNNMGMFCEDDGVIYFSNLDDNHYLYSMNLDGTNLKRLAEVPAAYINAAGDYLYFYYDDQGDAKFMGVAGNMHGIYRISKKGKDDLTCLDRCVSGIACLVDNTIYYQHYDNNEAMTFYSSSLDGKNKGQVLKTIVNPSCVINSTIYYPDTDDNFYLNRYTPGATTGSKYSDTRMYNPIPSGNYIYYMSVDNDYCLYRYELSSGESVKITSDRVDTFNVYDNMIFYQRNKKPALIAVMTDGSDAKIVAEGNFKNINCTSEYTYFTSFHDDTVYRTPTHYAEYVEEFSPMTAE